MTVDVPRPLTPVESSVLGLLLAVEFPGVEALRVQARSAVVVRRWTCGCPSIDLEVPGDVPSAPGTGSGPVPVLAVVDVPEEDVMGHIILFTQDGRLDLLECALVGELSTEWPALDRISVSVDSG